MTVEPTAEHLGALAPVLVGLLSVLFAMLTGVIAWVGLRMQSRLDSIATSLHEIERAWTVKLGTMDRRLTRVEALCPHCSTRIPLLPPEDLP
jgi:hypothetical protein